MRMELHMAVSLTIVHGHVSTSFFVGVTDWIGWPNRAWVVISPTAINEETRGRKISRQIKKKKNI